MCLNVSSRSKPLKNKQYGRSFGSLDAKDFQIFLHARHRAANTKLGLCYTNEIIFEMRGWVFSIF